MQFLLVGHVYFLPSDSISVKIAVLIPVGLELQIVAVGEGSP
jgi:hypothetical protein